MQSSAEIQQRKKQSWYVRDPEVRDAVRFCSTMRLSEKESLEELSKRGYDISDRTFRRIKSKVEPNKQRLDETIKQNYLVHVMKTFDKHETVEEILLDLFKIAKTVPEKLSIIREYKKNFKENLELCDSNPVIASLLKKLENEKRNGNVEEPK